MKAPAEESGLRHRRGVLGRGRLRPPNTVPQWAASYSRSLVEQVRYRDRIREPERFCFFIGYARSGHTLLASLLDAHPDIAISNELDSFRYIDHGFRRRQLYALILWHDEVFGHDKKDFTYTVPGGHHGVASRLRVIGDKRGQRRDFGWQAISRCSIECAT